MAHHKSAKKRIRQSAVRRLRNRYNGKTTRNAIRKIYGLTDKKEAEELFPKVTSLIDRLSKKNIIHKNKAANIKGKIAKHISKLS